MSLQESEFHEFIQELVAVPYRIAIPTYNRPEIFINKTLQYLDRCIVDRNNIDVFVEDEYQLSLYLATCAKEYPELNYIVTHTSGICEKRNFIRYYYAMENYNKYTFCMDDDIDTVMRKDKTEETNLDDFIIRGFLECDNVGATMFGISPLHNEFFLRDNISYNLNYIIGAFFGFVSEYNKMPYMTDMEHYEDFDFSLAHYFKDKKLVRFNHLGLKTKYFEPTGGITYQMGGLEARQKYMDENAEYMVRKWGDVVKVTKNKWGTGLKLNHLHRFKTTK
tara:strand:+ start:1525 stop:2358 length:834 start_codon:yes stop_codon:yes gene_type:complete